jgi:ABC-2 type transport system ATP-binding protein
VDIRQELADGGGDDLMDRRPVIEAMDLSVTYRLPRNPTRSVQEFAIRLLKQQVHYEDLRALTNVSFSLARGSMLGVIGANGAGKSTLMKAVARVLAPTGGRIIVRGRVAPLIELGAGFHPDMTGHENLLLYGTILGHDPDELRRHADEIAHWAEVQEFMDSPVRTYSSGMLTRLGFAVATWAEPDILVVDEVLAVGDERFQERSRQRIETLLGRGTAVLFVSHAMDSVRELAQTVLWLDHGDLIMLGEPDEVVDAYLSAQRLTGEGSARHSPAAVGRE